MAISKKPAVKIPVTLETGKAEKKAKGFSKSMVKSFAVLGGAVAGTAVAYKAVSAALGAAISLTKEAVKLAGVQEKAERNLTQAIRLKQTFTDQELVALQRFNFETQQATAFGDEELLRLQKQLTLQGVEKDMLEAVTKATIGLAQVKGSGLSEAASVVTRVIMGEVGALKESGIVTDSVSEAMDTLTGFFALAANETNTLAGQTKLLEGNWNDMLEEFGRTLWKAPEVRRVMRGLNRIVIDLSKTIVESQPAIVRFWDSMVDGIRGTGKALAFMGGTAADAAASLGPLLLPGGASMTDLPGFIRRTAARSSELRTRQPYSEPLFTMTDEANRVRPPAAIGAGTVLRDPSFVPGGKTPAEKAAESAAKAQARAAAAAVKRTAEALERQEDAADKEWAASVTKIYTRRKRLRLEQEGIIFDARLEQQTTANARIQENEDFANQVRAERAQAIQDQLLSIGVTGMTQFVQGMTQSILQGDKEIGPVMQSLFGGILQSVGGMLVALGTAAAAAALSSTAVPWSWPVTGGYIGIAGGLGIAAAGAVLTGVGGHMQATAGKAAGDAKRIADYSKQSTRRSEADKLGTARGGPQNTSAVYNINFNGALPGSERRIAREIKRIIGGGEMSGAYA